MHYTQSDNMPLQSLIRAFTQITLRPSELMNFIFIIIILSNDVGGYIHQILYDSIKLQKQKRIQFYFLIKGMCAAGNRFLRTF